jgi:hypothetical protein
MWQVVLTEGNTPGRHTSFPLMESESEFDRRVRNPPQNRKSPLEGIDPTSEKWAIVERSQPYKPVNRLMGVLVAFSNRDKHQGLLTPISFTQRLDPNELLTITNDPSPEVLLTFQPPDALEHNAEILRIKRRAGATVDMKTDLPFQITVSDGKDAAALDALDRLRSEVIGIIRAFEKFF